MNRYWSYALALMFVAGLPSVSFSGELPLKRVTLSTSGLAQFEHTGQLKGNTTISFPIRLDQVNDVLKSLLVLDPDAGFSGLTLAGHEALSRIFYEYPFGQDDLATPEALITALQGTEITISGPQSITGKLLGITRETETAQNGVSSTKHRLAVLAVDGLHTVLLEDISSLKWNDPLISRQLDDALSAIHMSRIQDQRELTLDIQGGGDREVTISYVTSAPLWKNTYRLVLPEGEGESAYLQGWAILENTTAQDWVNVAMSLISGNLVTYQQSLYESYYRERPVLPVRVMDQILPRTDMGAIELSQTSFQQDVTMQAYGGMERRRAVAANRAMATMDSALSPAPSSLSTGIGGVTVPANTAVAESTLAHIAFHLPEKITLPAGKTMMVPVISHEIPAEKLWLYQPETNPRHPLIALALENNSGTALPTGILTLFEKTLNGLVYSGDAELSILPKDEKRYITFALDPASLIDREIMRDRIYSTITASKGVIRQKILSRETTRYIIKAPTEEDRVIILEHPRRDGWVLQSDDHNENNLEKTDTHYRLRVEVEKGATKTINIAYEREDYETISIGQLNEDELSLRFNISGAEISPEIKASFQKILSIQGDLTNLNKNIQSLETERQSIFTNQNRIRNNLSSIPSDSDLAKNYLSDLSTQETRIKSLDKQQSSLREERLKLETELSDYISGLEF